MQKVKNFLKNRGVGYYLTPIAMALLVAAICLYAANGVTAFSPKLEARAIVYAAISLAVCLATLVVDFKPLKYVAYLLGLYAFMWFVYSQVTYIANVFVAIDGYAFSAGFVATLVCYVAAAVVALVSAITDKWQPWAKQVEVVVTNE